MPKGWRWARASKWASLAKARIASEQLDELEEDAVAA